MTRDRSSVASAGLLVLFVTVFFSVFLHQLPAAVGWLCLAHAAREPGTWRGLLEGRVRGLLAPILLFLLISAISASLGVVPGQGWSIVGKEVFALGFLLLGLFITSMVQVRVAVAAFLGMAALAGAWSIYQVLFEYEGVFNYHRRTHGFWHRDAFISYANALAMVFAFVLGLWFWGDRLRRLGAVAAVFAVIGMVTSYTRASWLAAGAILGTVALARRATVPLLCVAAIALAALLSPASDHLTDLAGRARSSFDLAASTNVDRVVRYQAGFEIVGDHPLLGTGPGGVLAVYGDYARPGATDIWHLHNTFLQFLAERGPLGLVAWTWLLVAAIVRLTRIVRRGDPEVAGFAAGIGLLLCTVLLLGIFNYVWDDWRMRSIVLAFIGLAWSPALDGVAGTEARLTPGLR